jgi:hypothetical protein
MLTGIKTNKEYRNDGTLIYEETIGIVPPIFAPLYSNSRRAEDGTILVRIGTCRKYKPNGKTEWELIYDNFGNIIH